MAGEYARTILEGVVLASNQADWEELHTISKRLTLSSNVVKSVAILRNMGQVPSMIGDSSTLSIVIFI